MQSDNKELVRFIWRVTSSHMISYFIAGVFALVFAGYKSLFSSDSLSALMLSVDSAIVAAGPSLQVVLGLAMALVLFPFRAIFLLQQNGWRHLLLLILGFSVFAPQLPAPGSFEGMIYTNISWQVHLLSLPESLLYSVLFSSMLTFWYRKPGRIWSIASTTAVCLIFVVSALGVAKAST